jgi:hypothetical protein
MINIDMLKMRIYTMNDDERQILVEEYIPVIPPPKMPELIPHVFTALTADNSETITVDNPPDYFHITVSGEKNIVIAVNYGSYAASNSPWVLADGGYLRLPAQGHHSITIKNVGTVAAAVRVSAVSGMDLDYSPGRYF